MRSTRTPATLLDASLLRRLGEPPVALLLLPALGALIALDPGVATAAAATLALVGGLLTLLHADATARRSRTAEYRARWDHPELVDTRVAASKFLTFTSTDPDVRRAEEEARWAEWNTWIAENRETKKRLQVMAVLNFWEEVSSAYNQDLLDKAWFQNDFAWQLMHNWNRAGWFIRCFRTEFEDADFFCDWQIAIEAVRDDLGRQTEDARRRAREVGPYEDILYVPRD
jgi:hypothetical protein